MDIKKNVAPVSIAPQDCYLGSVGASFGRPRVSISQGRGARAETGARRGGGAGGPRR